MSAKRKAQWLRRHCRRFEHERSARLIAVGLACLVSCPEALQNFEMKARSKALEPCGVNRNASLPRIAICVAGDTRSLGAPDYAAHFRAAILKPLCSSAVVDVYFQITGQSGIVEAIHRIVESATTYVNIDTTELKPLSLSTTCLRGSGLNWAMRNRLCYKSMVARERETGQMYDYILRTRPDLEYGQSLADALAWATLPDDIVWTMHKTTVGLVNSTVKLPVESVNYVEDFLKVLPRRVAKPYLNDIADEYERCIPKVVPPNMSAVQTCRGKWTWNECRSLHALVSFSENVSPLYIGRVFGIGFGGMFDGGHFILECEVSKDKKCAMRCPANKPCLRVFRRIRNPDPPLKRPRPLLSARLEPASGFEIMEAPL